MILNRRHWQEEYTYGAEPHQGSFHESLPASNARLSPRSRWRYKCRVLPFQNCWGQWDFSELARRGGPNTRRSEAVVLTETMLHAACSRAELPPRSTRTKTAYTTVLERGAGASRSGTLGQNLSSKSAEQKQGLVRRYQTMRKLNFASSRYGHHHVSILHTALEYARLSTKLSLSA